MSFSSASPVLAAALAVLLQPLAVAAQEPDFSFSADEPQLEFGIEIADPFVEGEPLQAETDLTNSPPDALEQLPSSEGVIPERLLPPWELEIQANRQRFDTGLQRFVATGDVTMRLAGGRLQADRVEYSPANRVIWARGSVRFQRGNQYLQASLLRYNLLQGDGELEDVYGVIDLTSLGVDLNPDAPMAGTSKALEAQRLERLRLLASPLKRGQSAKAVVVNPLSEPEQMACPPELPAQVSRLPGPWAVTAWGGQMTDATFGETFLFSGAARPEGIFGLGFNRRLIDADPFSIELDGNALFHSAADNRNLRYLGGVPDSEKDQAVTRAQTFWEGTIGIGLRWWIQPWLSLGVIEGVSMNSEISNYEKVSWANSTQFLNYLAAEITAQIMPQWSVVGRIHHRSGAYGTYDGVAEGSNGYLLGIRHHFGVTAAPASLDGGQNFPPLGCPGAEEQNRERRRPLEQQLESVVFDGPEAQTEPKSELVNPKPQEFNPISQQRERITAIRRLDQRITDVVQRSGLKLENRVGVGGFEDGLNEVEQKYDLAISEEAAQIRASRNDELITGEITHWRYQAPSIQLDPAGWTAPRISFTNDPFTPAQSWIDMESVRSWQESDGTTVVQGRRNRLLLENRLPVPLPGTLRFSPEEKDEVSNRWAIKVDRDDRDGIYLEYKLPTLNFANSRLQLRPQFMLERAIEGFTDSYPLPGAPAGSEDLIQPALTSDLFGLDADFSTPLFERAIARAGLEISSFSEQNLSNATRADADIAFPFEAPYLGDLLGRIYGAYRYRVWNGSLGKQDIYAAFGGSVQSQGSWPAFGPLTTSYIWTVGLGNYKATAFKSAEFDQLWRLNSFGALTFNYKIWEGKTLPLGPEEAYRYSPKPIVPGLSFVLAPYVSATAYGDGITQRYIGVSGGPKLTLGHFNRPVFDYTKLYLYGSSTAIIDQSPFSFDRFVDGATLGASLQQQIVGPVVLGADISYNVSGESGYFGEVTNSLFQLSWKRRAYEFGLYYSPYTGIGGVRIRLNDFGFKGTGLPFVPGDETELPRPFNPANPSDLDYLSDL